MTEAAVTVEPVPRPSHDRVNLQARVPASLDVDTMMNEVTLDELEVEDPDGARIVLRTTIRFDDGRDRPVRRQGPSVDTTVRSAIPAIVGELFDDDRPRAGADDT